MSDTPLAATVARPRVIDGDAARLQLGEPAGHRWLALDALADDGLDLVLAGAEPRAGGARDYLGASVAAMLADTVVTAGWPALLTERRLPDLRPANLAAHRHETEGWFDRITLRQPTFTALPDDPAAGHPHVTVVGDVGDLHRRFAHRLATAVAPWFDAVRRRVPFGRRGMWGQVADDLCGTALWTARRAGLSQHAAWEESHAVVNLIADVVPELKVRPRLFPVRWSGGETLFQVKGTCCLWYKTQPAPDPCGDGYCTTCPFRDDDARRSRLVTRLEEEAAG